MPAISEVDMIQLKSTTMAADFTTASVGGAASGSQVLGATKGEILFGMASNATGGGSLTQYGKSHLNNANATNDMEQVLTWLINSLDAVSGTQKGVGVSASAADLGAAFKFRWLGYDDTGASISEDVLFHLTDGTISVSTIADFTDIHKVEIRHASSSALRSDFVGPLAIYFGATLIGYISNGQWFGMTELDIGLALVQNDSATIALASTAPTSVTFSRPRTQATAFNCGGLAATESQGLWWRWVLKERSKGSLDNQAMLRYYAKVGG